MHVEEAATLNTPAFDRRQIYRPFLERLNPALSGSEIQKDLIVPRATDPRDPGQPPIFETFANHAELNRGIQMALVGGIGSGKTTELLLTRDRLKSHQDAVNIFIDASEFTNFSEANPGAMLAAIGLRLFSRLEFSRLAPGKPSEATRAAHKKLQELALGKTEWHQDDPREYDDDDGLVPVKIPGLMKPRFPKLEDRVAEIRGLLGTILLPFRERDSQITVIVDGLDRLIEPALFREFAEQDLRAVRRMKVTVIVAAPLLLWYDKSRFLQDYFDLVKHLPAAIADPKESDFLRKILKRRGAGELMNATRVDELCRFSGGVLRDLLTLAQSSAQCAYRDARDRIGKKHVEAAVHQLGTQYSVGLGSSQKRLLQRLRKDGKFSVGDPQSKELLVNRQVLEYSRGGRDYFSVHPALAEVLPEKA